MIGLKWMIEPRNVHGKKAWALVIYTVEDGKITGYGTEAAILETVEECKSLFRHLQTPPEELIP